MPIVSFATLFDGAVSAAAGKIVVDLGLVDYLDSSALGMLLMLRDKATGSNREIALSNCKGPVKQVLDIANFGRLFQIG